MFLIAKLVHSTCGKLLTENFRQMAKYFKVGKTMLAFHHDGCLYYCAASDEEENYPVWTPDPIVLKKRHYLCAENNTSTSFGRLRPSAQKRFFFFLSKTFLFAYLYESS